VAARRLDARSAGVDDLERNRFRVTPLHLRDARANRVARKTVADEDDEAVQPSDPVAPIGERVDVELELLVLCDRRGHAPIVAALRTAAGSRP
jgi:hypothetical protein